MANPKRRHSKARSRKRRATWKTSAPNLVSCPRCNEAKMPHRVCPSCGYYKDKQVVAVGDDD